MAFEIGGFILWVAIFIALAAFIYELWNEIND
jgi:hypothetical protein